MVDTGGIREAVEVNVRSYLGSGKGATETGIWQAWRGQGKGGGGGYIQQRGRGRNGRIGMLGQRQVTPGWADDPVRRKDIC